MSARKALVRIALVAAMAALCLALVPGALAGKRPGGGKPQGGSGTISPVFLDSTDGLPHYGQRVTFNVSTTATTEPWVNLKCYQGGVLVGQGREGFFDRSLDDGIFRLSSPSWPSGAADCTANLTKPDGSVLGSTSFHVYE